MDLLENAAKLADIDGNLSNSTTVEQLAAAGYLQEVPEHPNNGDYAKGTFTKDENGKIVYSGRE